MFHIYVDGSCIGNQNVDSDTPAGWGVVIITGSNDLGRGNGEIMHEFSGKVVTNPDDSMFIGAEVGSNNTAELTDLQKVTSGLTINENVSSKTLNTNPFDLRLIYNKRTGFTESYGFSVTIVKK